MQILGIFIFCTNYEVVEKHCLVSSFTDYGEVNNNSEVHNQVSTLAVFSYFHLSVDSLNETKEDKKVIPSNHSFASQCNVSVKINPALMRART